LFRAYLGQKKRTCGSNLSFYCNIYLCLFHQRFTQSFYSCRSQKCKKYTQDVNIFLLFWDLQSAHVKAAHKMFMKLPLRRQRRCPCWWGWWLNRPIVIEAWLFLDHSNRFQYHVRFGSTKIFIILKSSALFSPLV